MQSTFSTRYTQLNTEQQKAVDTIFWPVLVIAWPWSGKTELLAVRIANILRQTDAHPSNILCLTFTDNAARNMRERLRKIIGTDAYKVSIHTFHTFGLEIMNRFRYKLDANEELIPIDPIESSRIFRETLDSLPWNHPWKHQSRLESAIYAIRLLKESGITPEDFSHILDKNEQILNTIWPIIKKYCTSIFALGQKKDEKIQKVQLFQELTNTLIPLLQTLPTHHGLQETLAPVIARSLSETIDSIESPSDSKPITAWKNSWLETDTSGWVLKESIKQEDGRGILDLYRAYEYAMQQAGRIDFSDMILQAIHLIESDEIVAATLAEQYQWVMIDEYQDTNDAQLRLITSMLRVSPEQPNLFAVGDDDQSIYKFQWANIRNIRLLYDLYPDTKLIVLKENYRSYREIIAFSRTIMQGNLHNLSEIFPWYQKSFHAARGDGGYILTHTFANELEEIIWVATDIQKLIQSGVSPSDIAVITKKNHTLEELGKLLLYKQIPVALSKEENILENEVVILIIHILLYIDSLARHEDRDDLLIDILSHPMWNIHRLTLWEISRNIFHAKKTENTIWIEVLRNHSDKNIAKIAHFFIELTLLSHHMRLEDMIDLVTGVYHISLGEDYHEIGPREQCIIPFEDTDEVFISPLYEYYFSESILHTDATKYARHLANVRKLIESIHLFRENTGRLLLWDLREYMKLIREYDITLAASVLIGTENAVQCITAHKAKGLEYQHVYAIGLTEKQYKRGKNTGNPLPCNLALAPEKDNDDDIRRLIYTVCTRAKDRLVLTYAEKNLSEKSDSLVWVLSDVHTWTPLNAQNPEDITQILEAETRDITSLPYTWEERDFLQNILSRQFSLSVTALQNFLDLSQGWPEYFLRNNVLRFPRSKHESAIYGTAIHAALEDFLQDYHYKKTFHPAILIERFTQSLQQGGLEPSKEADLLARGSAQLEKLTPYLTGRTYGELHLEYRFTEGGGIYLPLDASDTPDSPQENNHTHIPTSIRLTGAIDRIEITPDGSLIITDYKTGGSLSSLTPKGSSYDRIKAWRYKLQLTFYALLFSKSARWNPWKHRKFSILFVESDTDTGEIHEITEYIQDGEIARLEALIRAVMQHVYTLNFPDIRSYAPTLEGILQFEEDLINWQI